MLKPCANHSWIGLGVLESALESSTTVLESVLIVASSVVGCVLTIVSRETIDLCIIVFPTVPAFTVSYTAPEFLRIGVVCPFFSYNVFLHPSNLDSNSDILCVNFSSTSSVL